MDVTKIKISQYTNTFNTKGKDTPFDDFINGIKNGDWQDEVLHVRTIEDKKERNEAKKKCPLFTVSGSFDGRKDSDIRKHSGFIAIDIDNVENPNTLKKLVNNDPYIYSAFISISGKGLCLIIKIDGTRHSDAFIALDKYLYETYGMIADKSCSNVARSRFVSYDPYIYINEDAITFKKYLPKPKTRKERLYVVLDDNIDYIVNEMYSRGVNICEDYIEWIKCAYALISEYDSNGINHFLTLSSMSSKYNQSDAIKQYEVCLKNHNESKSRVTKIDYIYDLAKMNGIDPYQQETKDIIRTTTSKLKNGCTKESIADELLKYNEIPKEQSLSIIQQIIDKKIQHESENIIDDIVSFLKPYSFRKNLISRNIEWNNKALDDTDINSIFLDCKQIYDKVTKDLVCSVLFSNRVEQYNPIKEFFDSYNPDDVDKNLPNINKLINSIKTDTDGHDKWITKWLVSICASAFGEYSPLMLVLSGSKQGTGKTHWFRYLLPKELRNLFAESKMDNGKDDEILMTKKLIILDDEFGGKSKREEKKLKEITAKEFINVREPYGRVSVDLRRLAVFCGTSNDNQILNDPTGNRRILPINIIDINKSEYNGCDKVGLWHEVYYLYKSGCDFTVLDDDIEQLNESTANFKASSIEEELILDKLYKGEDGVGQEMTITAIIQYLIADTKYNNLSNTKVGLLLSTLGFTKRRKKVNNSSVNVYFVSKTISHGASENGEYPSF